MVCLRFLSLLSYSIIMLRPFSIAWAGTTVVVSYYFTYVPLEMPLNFLLCCRLMNCLYCHPILSRSFQYPLPCLSINFWLEKDAIQAWRVGTRYAVLGNAFCMDVYQLRARNKINLKAFQYWWLKEPLVTSCTTIPGSFCSPRDQSILPERLL